MCIFASVRVSLVSSRFVTTDCDPVDKFPLARAPVVAHYFRACCFLSFIFVPDADEPQARKRWASISSNNSSLILWVWCEFVVLWDTAVDGKTWHSRHVRSYHTSRVRFCARRCAFDEAAVRPAGYR